MGQIFTSHSRRTGAEAAELRDWFGAEGYAETCLDLELENGLAVVELTSPD